MKRGIIVFVSLLFCRAFVYGQTGILDKPVDNSRQINTDAYWEVNELLNARYYWNDEKSAHILVLAGSLPDYCRAGLYEHYSVSAWLSLANFIPGLGSTIQGDYLTTAIGLSGFVIALAGNLLPPSMFGNSSEYDITVTILRGTGIGLYAYNFVAPIVYAFVHNAKLGKALGY